MAKQEVSNFGRTPEESAGGRYNPTRIAPPTPRVDRARQQPQGSLRGPIAQRHAPQTPNGSVSNQEIL